jgi:hypothetical protein
MQVQVRTIFGGVVKSARSSQTGPQSYPNRHTYADTKLQDSLDS